ncbi:hypothetical protein GOP47_0000736 [Adiantum capillus-veneris]|uniref:Uncharacterized protein n=1 Tax=Adiantum capillus-veneris TaxID=13818 RepID=A0A9D4VFP2_ADICA|nr:hypothetical protein GOP47_0000736 [Adiantum capillus-veneris]
MHLCCSFNARSSRVTTTSRSQLGPNRSLFGKLKLVMDRDRSSKVCGKFNQLSDAFSRGKLEATEVSS